MKLGVNFGISSRSSERSVLAGGFTAASISNLDLWYDFSTVTGSNGDAVSSFANAGGAGSDYNLSQGTGSIQPNVDTSELSLNSLNFDNDKRPRRQDRLETYVENGAFYITTRECLLESKLRYSGKTGILEMSQEKSFQIDTYNDLELIKKLI